MISLRVAIGAGDREMSPVSDDLISSEAMAKLRASQLLSESLLIVKSRSLSMPHDPALLVGSVQELAYARYGIYGNHLIKSRTIELTSSSALDSVEVVSYTPLEIEGI